MIVHAFPQIDQPVFRPPQPQQPQLDPPVFPAILPAPVTQIAWLEPISQPIFVPPQPTGGHFSIPERLPDPPVPPPPPPAGEEPGPEEVPDGQLKFSIGNRPILHPKPEREAAQRLGTPRDFVGRANSYTCPRGPEPGVAWLLMLGRDIQKMAKGATHKLQWKDGKRELTVDGMLFRRSLVINKALADEPNAAHLVEFHDCRAVLKLSAINKQYNVRMPAPSGQGTLEGSELFYTDSMNSGQPWTWQEMLSDIWGFLPGAAAGDAPDLPSPGGAAYVPDGTPENFRFIGRNTWQALHEVLAKIDCTTAYNPLDSTFSYVRLGLPQDDLTDSLTILAQRMVYNYDPGQFHITEMPETIRVFFHRREQYYGLEKDTTQADNWELEPVVSKDYATNFDDAYPDTVLPVWDDMPALFGESGNTNGPALQTRADEIGANVANTINVSDRRFRRHYLGITTEVLPGSAIATVRWRDYGDEVGLVTELIQRPEEEEGTQLPNHFSPPDLDQATHPLWPHYAQPVQVDDGNSDAGDSLEPNSDGLYPGYVRRYTGEFGSLDACWIRPVDLATDNDEDTTVNLRQKDTFIGRLLGVQQSAGDTTKPVYGVRAGGSSDGTQDCAALKDLFGYEVDVCTQNIFFAMGFRDDNCELLEVVECGNPNLGYIELRDETLTNLPSGCPGGPYTVQVSSATNADVSLGTGALALDICIKVISSPWDVVVTVECEGDPASAVPNNYSG
jgi:hypothetical protein